MEIKQNSISHQDGILILLCVWTLDEITSPPIFGTVVQNAKKSPQVVIFDLSRVDWIKTAFISGMIEISKYLNNNWGGCIIVPWNSQELISLTEINKTCHISNTLENGIKHAHEHYQQVIDFNTNLEEKKSNIDSKKNLEINIEEWKFFEDAEKKILNTENILKYAIKNKASDIHLTSNKHITYRIEWKLKKIITEPLLNNDHLDQFMQKILLNHPEIIEKLEKNHDVDFGYVSQEDGVSFRVNGAMTLGKLTFTLRRIEQTAKKIVDLWIPDGVNQLLKSKQWLILVTGPTGSGKSTTLVAMLEEINNSRSEKVITIEDPIEFIFTDNRSIFSQREVGRDTDSFVSAIRAAMREDPDIVMVGEMRDTETVVAALNLAETGHLVFSTLHTSWSVQTISRMIQFFSPEEQKQIFARIADSLIGVVSQRLVPRRDQENQRIALFEIMLVNSGIKNLIRSGDLWQLENAILMWRSEGMMPMYVYAQELEKKWIIHRSDYEWFFVNQDI